MAIELALDSVGEQERREVRRAARRVRGVSMEGETVLAARSAGSLDRLTNALWVREMTAREFGQHAAADADRTVRQLVERAG